MMNLQNLVFKKLDIPSLLFKNKGSSMLFSTTPVKESLTSFQKNDKRIGFLTLSNPQKRNPLSEESLTQLRDQLLNIKKSFQNEENYAKVVILNAQGPVFSAGHDLKEFDKSTSEQHHQIFSICSEVMTLIRQLPQPVIASVNGLATAAGLQLATSCDMIVATENSQFQCPGVKIGLFCTTPGIALIRSINSRQKAFEMLATGDPITAKQAFQYGIVNYVVQEKNLETETTALAERMIIHSSDTLALGKEAFYQQLQIEDLNKAYQYGCQIMTNNLQTEDCKEGIQSFVEQRHPKFKY